MKFPHRKKKFEFDFFNRIVNMHVAADPPWTQTELTFVRPAGLMLVEAWHAGPGLGGGGGLHVGQVLHVAEVSQHVLQLGPVGP